MPIWYKNVHTNFCNVPSYLDPFEPNSSENARRSFTSDQFFGIEISSYILVVIWYTSVHANFCNVPSYLDPFEPNSSENARRIFTSDQFLGIEIWS